MPVEYVEAVQNHVGGLWAGGEQSRLVKGEARARRGVAQGCSSVELYTMNDNGGLVACVDMLYGIRSCSDRHAAAIVVAGGGSCNVGEWREGLPRSSRHDVVRALGINARRAVTQRDDCGGSWRATQAIERRDGLRLKGLFRATEPLPFPSRSQCSVQYPLPGAYQ